MRMFMKSGRQSKIIEFVEANDIETQEELASMLNEAGFKVTQATISRDIRELQLTKVTIEGGRQKYALIKNEGPSGSSDKYIRVLCDGLVSMDLAQNILVVKTVSGMAMAVAAALDSLRLEGVVGCIAGDDTIMCAIKTVDDAAHVMARLRKIIADSRK